MMLLCVFTYTTYAGLYGTSTDTSRNMHDRLTNDGDMSGILDSHMDEGMRAPELNAGNNVRDGNGKKMIVKKEDTGIYGSGIDRSHNTYNMLTNNGGIWILRGSHLDEGRIKASDSDALSNLRDGKIRILKRENTQVWKPSILPIIWLSIICKVLYMFFFLKRKPRAFFLDNFLREGVFYQM